MSRSLIRVLFLFALLGILPGCLQLRHNDGLTRFWIDYNTLQAPALYLEELDHRHARRGRVKYFRWMYNQDHPPENPPEQAAQSNGEAVLIFESMDDKSKMMGHPSQERSADNSQPPGIRHIPPPVPPRPAPSLSIPPQPMLDDLKLQLPGADGQSTPEVNGPTAQNESRTRPASLHRRPPEQPAIMTPIPSAAPTAADRLRTTLRRNNGSWPFAH